MSFGRRSIKTDDCNFPNTQPSIPPKKAYESPQLRVYGDIREITQVRTAPVTNERDNCAFGSGHTKTCH